MTTKMIPQITCPSRMTSDIKLTGVECSNVVVSDLKCFVSDVSKERNNIFFPFRTKLGPLDAPDESTTVL